MNIVQKSPERIEAEVAAFAASMAQIRPSYQRAIFDVIGGVATFGSPAVDPTYLQFRREADEGQVGLIEKRVELAEAYEAFSPYVAATELLGMGNDERFNSSLFVASGGTSDVFRLDVDGEPHALRIPRRNRSSGYGASFVTEHYIDGLIRGFGIPGLEQLETYSYKDGLTISKYVQGNTAGSLTAAEVKQVTVEQTEDLLSTLEAMDQADLIFDTNAGNLIYDPVTGFHIVDYHHQSPDGFGMPQTLGDKVRSSLGFVCVVQDQKPTVESFQNEHDVLAAGLVFADDLAAACKRRYGGSQNIVKDVIAYKQQLQERIQKVSDPIWVQIQLDRAGARAVENPNWQL
jgi:hypothetical protein